MKTTIGWLFDLYAHPMKGIVLWLVGEDGKAYRFHQDFETVFYAHGPFPRLHELGKYLRTKYLKQEVRLERVTREDLFAGSQELMGIGVANVTMYKSLFQNVYENFSDLIFYDVDTPLTVRYAATYDVFMMARCEAMAEKDGTLIAIRALDTPYELDPKLPHFKLLTLRPNADPSHHSPQFLIAKFGKSHLRLSFEKPGELLTLLNGILASFDPDVIKTYFGDVWLFPHLQELSKKTGIPFNPNRDDSMPVLRRKEISFFNYGHAHYRAPQTHLRGRWHVDVRNCMTYNQYQLIGAIEQTRLSSLPLQEVTRRSPGAAIASMQDITAMRRGTLVPYQHQKGEVRKTFNQFVRADRGGLVFIPTPGVFENVAILDFSSKMASIMIRYNVSPETVVSMDAAGEGVEIPELGVKILSRPGLIPQTLRAMRDKRLALKKLLKSMDKNDSRHRNVYRRYKAVLDALKWLTVVCYGRLGFANSTFGRINAHEVVSYLSRKVITDARLIAEAKGFDILHVYVDSLFVSKPSASKEDFQILVREIEQGTGLPMDLENVYSWCAFLGSRHTPNVSVANRFYGIAPNKEHKLRGIALRRHDVPAFVAQVQRDILDILAKETDLTRSRECLPEVLTFLREQLSLLKRREVPLEQLVITQTLSRELEKYSVLSPLSCAARQLQTQGKPAKMGQRIRFLYMAPSPGVHAWDLSIEPNPRAVDVPRYQELTLRAVHEILQPLGVSEKILRDWVFSKAGYVAAPGQLGSTDSNKLALPIFNDLKNLRVDTF
ncbi:MAG TPA: DNA polymerase domain-containing protein [Anaerolineales bacterium]|nr:DNA polymerase domain-containing protein [Anaerolineales bacterium]